MHGKAAGRGNNDYVERQQLQRTREMDIHNSLDNDIFRDNPTWSPQFKMKC